MLNGYSEKKEKIKKFLLLGGGIGLAVVVFGSTQLWAEAGPGGLENVTIKEKQMVETNKNLKKAIEENEKLNSQTRELQSQIDQLKNESTSTQEQFQQLKSERDDFAKNIETVRNANRKYSQDIKKLETNLQTLQESHDEAVQQNEKMEERLASAKNSQSSVSTMEEDSAPSVTSEEVKSREEKTVDLLSRIDAFKETDAKLKDDSAKAHFNMGNIYFQKGEYELAAREFYQAVTLMPNDPDAHYNLAFVSSEYLKDYKTALEHYKMYLYLKPDAKDVYLVNEKITNAKLILGSTVESPLEKEKRKDAVSY